MKKTAEKLMKRTSRHARVRAKVVGTAARPRLAVFRSNRYVYAQLIDDDAGTTLVSADSRDVKGATARDRATEVGKRIAEGAKGKKVEAAVFDRGGYQYQGVIAALADGARAAGLQF